MKYKNKFLTGNEIVDAVGKMDFSGNVTPLAWFRTICYENGKPNMSAINILADIVYWYRPAEVRDEATGQLVGMRKKFRRDLLQRSYEDISRQYGITKRQAVEAIKALEKLGVVLRERRNIKVAGQSLNNVLYLRLVPEVLVSLTYPESDSENNEQSECGKKADSLGHMGCNGQMSYSEFADSGGQVNCVGQQDCGECETDSRSHYNVSATSKCDMDSHYNVGGVTSKRDTDSHCNVGGVTSERGTNTENTTEITTENTVENIYPYQSAEDCHCKTQTASDEMDRWSDNTVINRVNEKNTNEPDSIMQMLRESLEYDWLAADRPADAARIDEIVELLADVLSMDDNLKIRIAGAEYPAGYAKARLAKLDCEHIRYVLDCMDKNTTKISNIKAYLLTALFNAPVTISNYYSAEVNHDMYGKGD